MSTLSARCACKWILKTLVNWPAQVIDTIQTQGGFVVRGNQDDKALAQYVDWKSGKPLVQPIADKNATACSYVALCCLPADVSTFWAKG